MMKIKLTVKLARTTGLHLPGEVLEVSDATGAQMIKAQSGYDEGQPMPEWAKPKVENPPPVQDAPQTAK
jgi:hypothetical protein